jgi:hypothetical protein
VGLYETLFGRTGLVDIPTSEGPNLEPKGGSGRYNTNGFLDFDEINALLRGKEGLRAFYKMWKTDSDARKTLLMIVAAVVGGTWDIEPAGIDDKENPTTAEEEEQAEFARWALWESMDPDLPAHLWEAMTVVGRDGFAPFEQIYRVAEWNGRSVFALDILDLRRPISVDAWPQDGPRLAGIVQFTPGTRNGVPIGRAAVAAKDLVYYRLGAEGDNWEGESLLRPAYKHWKYKDAIERMQAMGIERTALGVPTGYPPTDAGADQLEAFDAFLANMRAGDATYFRAPGPKAEHADPGQGWHWEFVTPGTSRGDSVMIPEALKYHSDKIAGSVLEEFMRQGMDKVGTNATADTQQDPFMALCEAIVTIVLEAPINRQLIPRLIDYNFTASRYPKLKCSLLDTTTLTELATYVGTLAKAGAIRPEPRLEAFLRQRADLPEADEAAIKAQQDQEAQQAQADAEQAHAQALELTQAKGTPASGGGKQMSLDDMVRAAGDGFPTPSGKWCVCPEMQTGRRPIELQQHDAACPAATPATVRRTLSRADRPLKPHEQHMSLDRIERAIDGARQRFEQAAGEQVHALARSLAEQAQNGDGVPVAGGPAVLTDALGNVLEDLYHTGRATVREELSAQALGGPGVLQLAAYDRHNPAASALERLRARAQSAGDAIRAAIALALGRAGLHKGTDPAILQLAAERAGMSALRTAAQDHAAAALNLGRDDQATADSDLIAGSRYTSILDGNRCSHCRSADDDILRPLTDPVRLAHKPPNPECEGGDRCRCLEAFQFRAEAAPLV